MKERKYTYKEIAERSGVAIGTVSRYFNNYHISKNTKAKIKVVVDELNYIPNFAASSIKKKNKDIYFIVPFNIEEDANILIANGAASFLEDTDYNLFIAYSTSNSDGYLQNLQNYINRNPMGIILMLPKNTSDKLVDFIKGIKSTSVVVYNREIENIKSVNIDDFELIRDVTTEVLKRQKDTAFIGLVDKDPTSGLLRTNGFKEAIQDTKLKNSITLLKDNYQELVYEVMPKLFNEGFRSFVCATHTISFAVQKYLIENKQRAECNITDIGAKAKFMQINKPDYYVFIDYYLVGIKLIKKLISPEIHSKSIDHKIINF